MKKGTDFLRNNLQSGTDGNSAALRAALLQWCYCSRNFGASPTVAAGSGTGANDDNRMQVGSLMKGKEKGRRQTPKPERNSHKQHEQYRQEHVQELSQCRDIGKTFAGDQVEELTTTTPVTTGAQIGARTTRKAKVGVGKRISLPKQPQPCRILHTDAEQVRSSHVQFSSGTEKLTINSLSSTRR